jgi:hypothetical protein
VFEDHGKDRKSVLQAEASMSTLEDEGQQPLESITVHKARGSEEAEQERANPETQDCSLKGLLSRLALAYHWKLGFQEGFPTH